MPAGVVLPFWLDRPPREALEIGHTADRLGYPEVWVGEMLHFDAMALGGALAASTRGPTITVGPVPVDLRDPVGLAMGVGAVSVVGARPARLALGGSSPAVVERWHGREWGGEAEKMAEALSIVRAVLAGDRTDHAGPHFHSHGFRSGLGPQVAHLTVAAQGPRMRAVAAAHADRLVMNIVSPRQVAAVVGEAAVPVAVWVVTGVEPSTEAWRQVRRQLALYLKAPGYRDTLVNAGWGALVEEAMAGKPLRDLAPAITEDAIATVAALGSSQQVVAALTAYERAGAEVMVVPVTAGDPSGARTLTALAG